MQIGGRGTNQGAGVGVKGQGCESRGRGAAQGAGEAFALVQEQLLSTSGLLPAICQRPSSTMRSSQFMCSQKLVAQSVQPKLMGFLARISIDADLFAAPAPLLFHYPSDQIRSAAKNMTIEANTRGLLLFLHERRVFHLSHSHWLVLPILC